MTSHIKLARLSLLAIVTFLGCKADRLNLPEPATLIVGTYQAVDPAALLTIKGDKVILTVKRVSADIVDVKMQAYRNNQPADSLVYERAKVVLNTVPTSLKQGCVSPYVSLALGARPEELSANCSEEDIVTYKYVYIPAGQQTAAILSVKFKSL
ncbi:hypothetical protein IC229_26275 [Spirosoma sp. BT702]|uniref:Uncharacterized protein n=1 Tax=Spirosoma profusum TaxID=2771354 RepID=A0A926Y456_9BACT|nr:hypothetical protein [Spirosoma profusum]MBD2704178.1 hypothetical protein [Spirosoma profusum]